MCHRLRSPRALSPVTVDSITPQIHTVSVTTSAAFESCNVTGMFGIEFMMVSYPVFIGKFNRGRLTFQRILHSCAAFWVKAG